MKRIIRKVAGFLKLGINLDLIIHYWNSRKKEKKAHNHLLLQFYSSILKKNSLCFDVGANLGDYSATFAKLGATSIAIEPQAYCYAFLSKRFSNHPKITVIKKGLSETEGIKELYVSDSHTISSMSPQWIKEVKKSKRFAEHEWNKVKQVEVTTLDTLIQEFGVPDYCKIDVEGYEYEVLKGLSQSIKLISVEYTTEYQENTFLLIQHLKKLGEIEFNFYTGKPEGFELPTWCNEEEIISYLKLQNALYFMGDLFIRFK